MPRSGTQSEPRMLIPLMALFLFHYRAQSRSTMISHRHILAICYSGSCAASAAAARTIVCLKACSAGEAVTAETRPVEQTIYSPTEFRSPRFAVPSLSFQRMAGTQPFAMARAQEIPLTALCCFSRSSAPRLRYRRYLHVLMSLIPHRRRRTRRQWARVDLDHALRNAHAVGDELLCE